MNRLAWLVAALMLMGAAPLQPPAPIADQPLADAGHEARAQALHRSLRCVVCQNESISESNAVLAADLRQVVRERVAAGDTDQQVLDYMVERYGDFVLMKPPFETATWLLWLGPFLILAAGALGVGFWLARRRSDPETPPLDAREQARLDALLDEEDR